MVSIEGERRGTSVISVVFVLGRHPKGPQGQRKQPLSVQLCCKHATRHVHTSVRGDGPTQAAVSALACHKREEESCPVPAKSAQRRGFAGQGKVGEGEGRAEWSGPMSRVAWGGGGVRT